MVSFSVNKSGLALLSFIDPSQKYFCKFVCLPVRDPLSFLNKVLFPFNDYSSFPLARYPKFFSSLYKLPLGMVFGSTLNANND
jgi:hypothetical protein